MYLNFQNVGPTTTIEEFYSNDIEAGPFEFFISIADIKSTALNMFPITYSTTLEYNFSSVAPG